MSLVSSSTDSGLSRLHQDVLPHSDALDRLHKRWEGKIARIITKLEYGDEPRAIRMLMELKADIKEVREASDV